MCIQTEGVRMFKQSYRFIKFIHVPQSSRSCMKSLCVLQAAVLEAAHQRGFRAEVGEGTEDLL